MNSFDAVVIGGGPAGSICALTLADQGHSVALLERQTFPRFHIGESMLAYMSGLFEQLGLLETLRQQGYVVKRGVEFTDGTGFAFRADFSEQGPGRQPETVQVERAVFDQMLLDQARAAGAKVFEDAPVTELLMDDGRITGVRYQHGGQENVLNAAYVVDASGRTGKISQRFGLRRMIEKLRNVAVFRHYGGLDERHNPSHEGDIQVGNHPEGWVWAIPIHRDAISIGAVMPRDVLRSSTKDQVFDEHLKRIPRIMQRLTGTTASYDELRVETDYCYYTDTLQGPGWLLAGDAGCFGDPMFSGGTYLAMVTGARAAESVAQALADPSTEESVMAGYESFFKTGYDTYFRLIYAFYENDFNVGRFVDSLPFTPTRDYIVRLLSGDFWSTHNPIAESLRAQERFDTFAPFEPAYGCPIYPELDAEAK